MYVSRLNFHTLPGNSSKVEERLGQLAQMVEDAGGARPRILRTHFASLGAPDVVFEQDAEDLAGLERQIGAVTGNPDFQQWSDQVSSLLAESPKREVYIIT
ncbi:MAG: hypothetical protein WD333_09320 [Dehalococcoidia bacterium]